MGYDAVAESRALLAGAPPAGAARLSRRRRFVPLAADRDGAVAVTLFLRRGVSGAPLLEAHAFESTGGVWRLLGGGGGPGDAVVAPRPGLAELAGPAWSPGSGSVARSTGRWPGRRRDRWVHWAELRVAEEVAVLAVAGRVLPVARHGAAVVVWSDRPPPVTALDAGGALLGPVRLDGPAPARWPPGGG